MTALTALELKGAGPDEEAFGWDMLAALPALRRITYSNNEYFERLPAVVSRLTELQYVVSARVALAGGARGRGAPNRRGAVSQHATAFNQAARCVHASCHHLCCCCRRTFRSTIYAPHRACGP